MAQVTQCFSVLSPLKMDLNQILKRDSPPDNPLYIYKHCQIPINNILEILLYVIMSSSLYYVSVSVNWIMLEVSLSPPVPYAQVQCWEQD